MKLHILEHSENYMHIDVTGQYTFEKGNKVFQQLHSLCIDNKIDKLLVSSALVEGYSSTMERFEFGELIAKYFSYKVKFALVAKKDHFDKFAENVAVNRGASFAVFLDKTEALEWLNN
jgi:hypothetical protein